MWRKVSASLRKPGPSSCLYSSTTNHKPYINTGSSPRDLAAVNAHLNPIDKIREALNRNLFASATIVAVKQESKTIPLEIQNDLIRGLSRFHPRLTPINFMALRKLSVSADIESQSIDKALLLQTLIAYGDQQSFSQGLELVHKIKGGPIPVSAIMRAVKFAYTSSQLRSCESLWNYVKAHYMLQIPKYTSLMVDLMKTFARAKDYQQFAKEVAEACLNNATNPSIALSIAKVAYMLRDRVLSKSLLDLPNFQLNRQVRGAIVQFDAALGASSNLLKEKAEESLQSENLTDQEFSGVVKGTAVYDLDEAEKSAMTRTEGNANILAKIALANQFIENKDSKRFRETIQELEKEQPPRGIMLNLRLKWELMHGSFWRAQRHYQNFRNVSFRQRVIASNTLSSLASDESEKQWVHNERQRLASVKINSEPIL